MCDREMQI